MRIFLLSFLGSFFGIITIFIVLNLFKKFRNLIFSDKALDYKVFENHRCHKLKIIPDTKVETYKIELDKYIGRIEEYRKEKLEKDFNKIKNEQLN